jgi:hypothetical protein
MTAGFESVQFWWSIINKNMDWINYIYYNQQRFVNYTRDAVKGIAELVPTSKMSWENRMALGMILADKGEGYVSRLGANAVQSSPTQLRMGP